MLQNSKAKPRPLPQLSLLPYLRIQPQGISQTDTERCFLSSFQLLWPCWAGHKLCTACLTAENATFCHHPQARAVLKVIHVQRWNDPTCDCDPVWWPHGVGGVSWVFDVDSLCACVRATKKSPGWGKLMLHMLWPIRMDICSPLAGPSLFWPRATPPSSLMVLYLLQVSAPESNFQVLEMGLHEQGSQPTSVWWGRSQQVSERSTYPPEIFMFKILVFHRLKAHLYLHIDFHDQTTAFVYVLKKC